MRRSELERWLRSAVLGISAAPLVLSGCGRETGGELELHELGVIPSRDGGRPDSGFPDAGRPDSGVPDSGVPDSGVPDSGVPDGGGCSKPTKPADAGWLVQLGACTNEVMTMHHGLVRMNDACSETGAICDEYCGGVWSFSCHLFESEPSEVVCWQGCVGRLVEGATPRSHGDGVAGALAMMAAHEGAAALAFDELAGELSAHRLPPALIRAARRAAHEERRHTRLVGDLARASGGRFAVTHRRLDEPRTLEAIALENAREGCARETLGAMVGLHQSRHAATPALRAVMAQVSADELGHASWSQALAQTLDQKLSRAARRRVREARDQALHVAAAELTRATSADVARALGVPDEERLHTLTTAVRDLS